MQCVILAGGLGTRMWPDARTIPKTLLDVAGQPFAGWQLRWLADAEVNSVVYCIGYLGEQVREFAGDGSAWGLSIDYVDEGEQLRGTAGALRLAAEQGVLADQFLVLYGDSWLQVDPADVYATSRRSGRPALMTVFENRGQWDGSNVIYRDGVVERYEKGLTPPPPQMRWIDYGLSVFARSVIEERVPVGVPSDLAPLCSEMAAAGELSGYLVAERFYEIGSPAGRAEAEALLRQRGSTPPPRP